MLNGACATTTGTVASARFGLETIMAAVPTWTAVTRPLVFGQRHKALDVDLVLTGSTASANL